MQRFLFFKIIFICLILAGCSPKVAIELVDTTDRPIQVAAENTKRLYDRDDIVVLGLNQPLPKGCRLVGKLKIGDSGFTTDCSYETVINRAMETARKAGGNIIQLTELKTPGFTSTCYQIKANILYMADAEVLEKELLEIQDSISRSKFGNLTGFAILYIFRPKNQTGSALSYDVHIGDSVVCRARNGSKCEIKINREGRTTVWAKTESADSVSLDIRFGKEYYIRCGLGSGLWVARPVLRQLDRYEGYAEYMNVEGRKD